MGSCFKNLLFGATLVLSFLPQGASSCTTIIAGNLATVDGTIYVARNADNSPLKVPYYIFHEASTKGPTRYSTRAKGGVNDFTITLPAKTLAYSSIPNWKTKIHGAAGFNSAGVGISATETIYIKPEVLKKDPFNTRTGITEDDIVDVILAQATSAKDGVRILGEIIKQKGAGEGFGVAFVDAREAWYLETASGHRWMARRVPNDCYFVAANQGRLRDFRAFDPDFAGSVDLIDWAQKEGFLKQALRLSTLRPFFIEMTSETIAKTRLAFGRHNVF